MARLGLFWGILLASITIAAGIVSLSDPTSAWPAVIGCCALLLVAALVAPQHCQGWLSPAALFVLAGVAYTLPTALTIALQGVLLDSRLVADDRVVRGAGLALVAWGSAVVGFIPRLGKRNSPPGVGHAGVGQEAAFSVGIAATCQVIAGLLLVGIFVLQAGGLGAIASAGYGERFQLMEGKGMYLLGLQSIGVGGTIAYAVAAKGGPRAFRLATAIAFAALFVWTSAVASRSALVHALIALIVVHQGLRGRIPKAILVGIGSVGLAAGLLVGVLRAGIDLRGVEASILLAGVNPANAEFGAPLPTIGDVMDLVPKEEHFRLGETAVGALGTVVPGWIWPERPGGAGAWYVERLYPDFADIGGAYAFSPVAEAYLNFGVLGVVLGFLLVGFSVGSLQEWSREPRLPLSRLVLLAVATPWILLFPRLDLATFVKGFCVLTVAQAVSTFVFARLLRSALNFASRRAAVPT
ncbi:MAG: O-antigen polysaccharide polymerase Wzy [Gemmatimonadales bacterium]|nr:O-antigen polysaccharide polymerase Wzy [Gemmatimonadales bacterium]